MSIVVFIVLVPVLWVIAGLLVARWIGRVR